MAFSAEVHEVTEPATNRSLPSASKWELWLLLFFLTVLYVLVVRIANRRFVWFDELLTFDIARSPSLHQLWRRDVSFDSCLPAAHILSRFSMAIFGPTPLGLRFPSMAEFYLGSIAILFYARRWVGNAFAGLAVVLLWSGQDFYYATEARPYALMFMSFACLLFFWDTATQNTRRGLALAGVALSTVGLLCAHVLGIFALLPFLAAEAVRFWRRRKTDYPLWTALLLPMVLTLQYLPLMHRRATVVSPATLAPTFAKMFGFFFDTGRYAGPAIFLAAVVVLLLPGAKRSGKERGFRFEDWMVLAWVLLIPIWMNLLLMLTRTQFYNRYCLATDVTLCAAFAILLARRLNAAPLAGWAAIAAVLIATFLAHRDSHLLAQPQKQSPKSFSWAAYRTDLPLVDADGQTFYEMNHHGSPALVSRLYYLKDLDASMKYSGTNFFQSFEAPDDMQKAGFPLAGHVEPYALFVRQHHQFLVEGEATDWLLRLLGDQKAAITFIGDGGSFNPYPRVLHLYLVTMPSQ